MFLKKKLGSFIGHNFLFHGDNFEYVCVCFRILCLSSAAAEAMD